MTHARLATGRAAETLVCEYLRDAGFVILEQNARVGRLEIDIVARRGSMLVVCEVRARRGRVGFSPAETIDSRKVARVRRAAAAWLAHHRPGTRELRFDAAAVTYDARGHAHLDYFEEAF